MKKYLAIIISVLLILTLAGCKNNSKKYKLPPEREPGTNIELTLLNTYTDEEYEVLREIITLFEKEHNDITINVERAPRGALWGRITKGLAMGETPDIAIVDKSLVPLLADRSAIINLNILGVNKTKDEYIEGAMEWNTFNNQIWGITDQFYTKVLFYNRDLFDLVDIEYPAETWTWTDLRRAANKFSLLEGVYGFSLGNNFLDTLPIINSFGANPLLISSTETKEALNFMTELVMEGAAPNPWDQETTEKVQGFKNGKYAIIMADMRIISRLQQSNINYGTSLIPEGKGGAYSDITGTSMVIFRNSPHPREAYKFIRFLTSEKSQAMLANQLGRIPVNQSALNQLDFEKHPHLELFIEQLDKAKSPPRILDITDLEEIISSELQQVFNGSKGIEDALRDAANRMRN